MEFFLVSTFHFLRVIMVNRRYEKKKVMPTDT